MVFANTIALLALALVFSSTTAVPTRSSTTVTESSTTVIIATSAISSTVIPYSNRSEATTSASATAAAASSASLDLGCCSNPTIRFVPGFDGRTEESFEPADKGDFDHGSADNIGVITSFICQQLADKCKASQAALTVCSQASSTAAQLSGQAAADAFSNVFTEHSGSSRNSGSEPAAVPSLSQTEVTNPDLVASAGTATCSADSNPSTSASNGWKPNGQRKGQNGGDGDDNEDNSGDGSSTGAGRPNSNSTEPVLRLLASNVQSASDSTGVQAQSAEKGQAASATDPSNFINFCSGKTLTNGLQVKSGSCNGIVMGDIPSTADMVSQIITFPEVGKMSKLKANQTFKITVQTSNLDAGSFTNPDTTYYAAPQQLKNGKVIGHTHVTVQDLGRSLTPKRPLDPSKFVFFKGINDGGDGQGGLSATVTGGLPAGNYRVCTIGSSSNHQPFLMPVAQRGAQDDCQKFVVQ
ncbi:MAG: hypothetical protein M1830_009160 [Pleopsidium flavum]|nr:MAG: hypothetical protein M1830_009160 [Pleopsidium flavum]